MWAGPVGNRIAACEQVLALDCATIVPGHGPVTDKRGVDAVRNYLGYIRDEARKRYDAGLSARDAAHDIARGDYDPWGDATPPSPAELFAFMGEIWRKRRA